MGATHYCTEREVTEHRHKIEPKVTHLGHDPATGCMKGSWEKTIQKEHFKCLDLRRMNAGNDQYTVSGLEYILRLQQRIKE